MNFSVKRLAGVALTLAFAVGIVAVPPALAAGVTINVNGSTVSFDQPPVERGGRVFVPLRGVFERLGASVVYSQGTINAQGNNRAVTLHIGSNRATINGQSSYLDQAPFLIGARTLVPLRFVAQALGASVNYDYGSRTVYIKGGSGSAASGSSSVTLTNLSPANGGVTRSNTPEVSGQFSSQVDPNSVHISLDGRDITSTSSVYVSATGFQIGLPRIPAAQHTVGVSGKATSGQSFNQSFTFTSGTDTSKPFVNNLKANGRVLSNGSTVPATYTLTGTTTPNARILIAIGYQQSVLNGLIPTGSTVNTQTVTANANGRFTADIDSSTIGSPSTYTIAVTATNMATKAASAPVHFIVHS